MAITVLLVLPVVGGNPSSVAGAATPPTVSGVSPTSGPAAGGTSVTVTGANFTGATAVDFGATAATGFSVTDSSSLTATVPPLTVLSSTETTTVDVTVTSPMGTSATSTADQYTYTYSSGGFSTTISASSNTPGTGQHVTLTATANQAPSSPETLSIMDETPRPAHVMVIMMENESAGGVIGNSSLPYINDTLAADYPQLTQNYAVAHPSLPNYLELLSGSTQGVTTDCNAGTGCEGTANLANQLDSAGISWSGYMENIPSAGYSGTDTGCQDGYGDPLYEQHHNPFAYFPDLSGDLATHVKPLSSMVSDLNSPDPPAFVWATPNMLDDMHDGPLSTGDTWLSQEIPAIQATQWYQQGGQIILTFDEGADSDTSGIGGGAGGHIPGFLISQALQGTPNYSTPVDQAGILRSIEQVYGVSLLNDATDSAHGSLGSELTPGNPAGSVVASSTGSTNLAVNVSQWAASSERFVARIDEGGSAPISAVSVPSVVTWSGLDTSVSPVVTGVCPFSTTSGGTSVAITGSNLAGATAVDFGAAPATTYAVDSATTITATAPAESAGTVDVEVTSPGGTSVTGPEDHFTYYATPTVTGVSPSVGSTSGGTSVTLTGTNFTGATAVYFGTAAASAFTVVSPTSMTATAPAGVAGTVDITVTTPGGTSAESSADRYTYTGSSGTITAVGTLASNAATGVATLSVSPQHAGDLLILAVKADSTSITVLSVSGGGVTTWSRAEGPYTGYGGHDLEIWSGTVASVGTSTITVVFSGSVSAVYTGLAAEEFAGPAAGTVWGIDTGAGIPNASSTTVTFPALAPAGAGELYFGYATVANSGSAGSTSGVSYATTSDDDVVAYDTDVGGALQPTALQSPGGVSGALALLVTASTPSPTTPTVTGVSPTSGPAAGGTSVTVTGTNFTGATAVTFGTAPAVSFTVTSDTTITATAPAGTAHAVDVTVTSAGGTSATSSSDLFTCFVTPTVTSVSPTFGPTTGGTTVTITGTTFTGVTAVDFGPVPASSFTVNSATQITATSPSESPVTVDVTVTNPGGTSPLSAADRFSYFATPAVTSVSPASGYTTGGTPVTITGTGFTGASALRFGTATAAFTVTSDTQIVATSPSETSGTVDVSVTNPVATSVVSPSDRFSFTVVPAPAVSAVSPSSGPLTGGTSTTISGTNFVQVSGVSFGPVPASSFTVNSATQITAVSPAGTTGTVDVTVTNPGGTSAVVGGDRFTYAGSGYWMVGDDGSVFAFGGAPYEGSLPGLGVRVSNIVSLVPTADSRGYWMIGSDGGVFAFGDAGFVGSLPSLGVHVHDIVGVVPTRDGRGYWMIGSDGGVFAFGDAGFVGSLPGLGVHVADIVAVVPTGSGDGYWMIGSDGGVFAFGDAGFVGSLPGLGVQVHNIVGAVPTSDSRGYWMVGDDGGVFAFGDAGFVGSLPGLGVHVSDVVGVVATHDGRGYWMVGSDGGVFAFGDAGFVGSVPGLGLHVNDIVAFARQ